MGRRPSKPTEAILRDIYEKLSPTVITKDIRLNLNRVRTLRLYFLYDIHLGSKSCAKDALNNVIQRIKSDPYAYFIFGGDTCEFINMKDKRFEPDDVDPEFMGKPSNIIGYSVDKVDEMFAPIAHKSLVLLAGNHEITMSKYNGTMPTESWIERWHKLPKVQESNHGGPAYGGYESIFNLRINKDPKQAVSFYMSHGWGGGRLMGSKANRIKEMASDFDTDVYISGHSHTAMTFPGLFYRTDLAKGKVIPALKWFIRAPSFKFNRTGNMQYEVRAGYHNSPVGY